MQDLMRALSIVITNTVIVVGTLRANLDLSHAVLLYWFEGTLASLLMLHLIVRHRETTHKKGHFSPTSFFKKQRTAALAALLPAGLLCGFPLVFPALVDHREASQWGDLARIGGAVALFQLVPHLIDLIGIRYRSFGWITGRAQRRTGENLIILLAVGAGVAIFLVAHAMLVALVAIAAVKSFLEFVIIWATANPAELSEKPPLLLRWLSRNKPDDQRESDFQQWADARNKAVTAVVAGEAVLSESEYRSATYS